MEPMNTGSLKDLNEYLSSIIPDDKAKDKGSFESDKIKTVLAKVQKDLESYAQDFNARLERGSPNDIGLCEKQLKTLKNLVDSGVQSYHDENKTSFFGAFKERIHAKIYGDIDQMKDGVLAKINTLNQNIINKVSQDIQNPQGALQQAQVVKDQLVTRQGKPVDRALPISSEPLAQIISYLPDADFVNFSKAIEDKPNESEISKEWITRAKALGFEGNDNVYEAKEYIKNLGKAVERFLKDTDSDLKLSDEKNPLLRLLDNLQTFKACLVNQNNTKYLLNLDEKNGEMKKLLASYLSVNQVVKNQSLLKFYFSFAASGENKEMIEMINYIMKITTPDEKTTLMCNILESNTISLDKVQKYADLLLESGANLKNISNGNPFFSAIGNGYLDFAKKLAEEKADINYSATNFPILFMSHKYPVDKVKFLLELGADPNTKDKMGRTPLCYLLNKKGYNTYVENEYLFSPISLEKCLLLISHGADIYLSSDKGDTPISIAEAAGQHEFADKLIDAAQEYKQKHPQGM